MKLAQPEPAYPVPTAGLALHRIADGAFVQAPDGQFEIDSYVVEFLESLTGSHSLDELEEIFRERYGPLFGPELAKRALQVSADLGLCDVLDAPTPEPVAPLSMTGSAKGFQPVHATLEIIETCNFTCSHCYYSSSPQKRGILDLDKCMQVLDMLASRGVTVVEITGGECTIHPDFLTILDAAAERFSVVAVISNGLLLGRRPKLRERVARPDNVIVQISIDGLEEYHDEWRRKKGSFQAACTAVSELSSLGVPVRMASTISAENVDQVGELFLLGKRLGVAAIAFAPVAALGRGCNVVEPGLGATELRQAISAALAPHAGDPLLRTMAVREHQHAPIPVINCGAGSRTYAIDYDGNVRACNFSRDSKKFGNIFDQPYETLFDQEANGFFRNAPSPGGEECQGCEYLDYCRGCFVKAFMTSESVYPECPWRQKWFPEMSLDAEPFEPGATRDLLPLVSQPPRVEFHNCGRSGSGSCSG